MINFPPPQWHEVTWYSRWGSIIFFIAVLPILCFYLGMRFQDVTDDLRLEVAIGSTQNATSTSKTDAIDTGGLQSHNTSLLRLFAEQYKNSSSSFSGCLSNYLRGRWGDKNNFNVTTVCPEVVVRIPLDSQIVDSQSFEETLLLKLLIADPKPAESYLVENWNTFNEDGEKLLKLLVYAKHLNSGSSTNPSKADQTFSQLLIEGTQPFQKEVFSLDSMSVTSTTKLVLINDLYNAGAYNVWSDLYQITITDKKIAINYAKLISTRNGKINEVKQPDPTEYSSLPGLVNAYFDNERKLFVEYGMLPYGGYPCIEYYNYKYIDSRLIHVSTDRPRGCKDNTFIEPGNLPGDFDEAAIELYRETRNLPEEFDSSLVEIYRIKDADLTAALQY